MFAGVFPCPYIHVDGLCAYDCVYTYSCRFACVYRQIVESTWRIALSCLLSMTAAQTTNKNPPYLSFLCVHSFLRGIIPSNLAMHHNNRLFTTLILYYILAAVTLNADPRHNAMQILADRGPSMVISKDWSLLQYCQGRCVLHGEYEE